MGKEIFHKQGLIVKSFYGGSHRGRCLQISIVKPYADLTMDDARSLYIALRQWFEEAFVNGLKKKEEF